MKYQGDIGLYLSGAPVPLPECALFVTQPTVKQVVQFGETDFLTASHLLGNTEDFVTLGIATPPQLDLYIRAGYDVLEDNSGEYIEEE